MRGEMTCRVESMACRFSTGADTQEPRAAAHAAVYYVTYQPGTPEAAGDSDESALSPAGHAIRFGYRSDVDARCRRSGPAICRYSRATDKLATASRRL